MTPDLLLSVFNIVVIDLVLSGDNAVVIAMAVQHLPDSIRNRAAVVGALGAVALRVVFTAMAAMLLGIPLLQAIGGAVLFWIALKLLHEQEEDHEARQEVHGFWQAIRIIILADVVMSLDNILAVGGASHGNILLLLFGLALSIPLVLFGSSMLATAMKRWPMLSYVGAGILAWTAGEMVVHDRVVHAWLAQAMPGLDPRWLASLGVCAVLGLGWGLARRAKSRQEAPAEVRESTLT